MELLALLVILFSSFSVFAFQARMETGVIDDGASALKEMKASVRSNTLPETTTNLVEAHIVGGRLATQGDYPWLIKSVDGFGTCSATLIHSDMALTAAHCQGMFVNNQ